jgi:molybdenum cofactor cytidylyltransferase
VGVTAIVLAAGFSRRFGSRKQLHELGGETLIHRAARLARSVAPTIVVVPADAPLLRDAVTELDVTIIENREAGEGMASSIRAGVTWSDGDVLLLVCDQPGVTAEHLQALIDARAPIAASAYEGTLGVPAFFSASYRDELLALRGDAGAKALLTKYASIVAPVPLADARDVDRLTADR